MCTKFKKIPYVNTYMFICEPFKSMVEKQLPIHEEIDKLYYKLKSLTSKKYANSVMGTLRKHTVKMNVSHASFVIEELNNEINRVTKI